MSRIEALNQLRSDFVRLAQAEQQRTAKTRPPQPRLHPRILVAASVLACALVLGTVITTMQKNGSGTSASSGTHPRPVKGQGATSPLDRHGLEGLGSAALPLPPIGHNPFAPAGRHVSLARARVEAGYRFPIPQAPAANPSILSDVWITQRGLRREVALQYRLTEVRLFIRPAPRTLRHDPVPQLQTLARGLHLGRHAVQTVAGSVILTDPQPGFADGPTIMMIYPDPQERLEIEIVGSARTTSATLIAVARSIATGNRPPGR